MMRIVLTVLIILCSSAVFGQDCNIRDFLVQNVKNITQSGESELAFVLSSSEEEFNKASKSIKGGGTYKLVGGKGSWDESKDEARRIARNIQFDSRESYATHLFEQTVDQGAISAYRACLDRSKEAPGVYVWLDKREGEFLTFKAYWVGSDVKVGVAPNSSVQILPFAAQVVGQPITWIKAKVDEITIQRRANVDFALRIVVGDQQKTVVVVRDPPPVVWKERTVKSGKVTLETYGENPGCSADKETICVGAGRPGGYLKKNSQYLEGSSTAPGYFTTGKVVYSSEEICQPVRQTTGACQVVRKWTGRLVATEIYPTAGN